MIDYGAKSHLGAYSLKIEISSRNKFFLQNNLLQYSNKNGVNVYNIDELVKMKATAFNGRDKIRDFYDLGFLLQRYPQYFSKELLFSIYEKISYAGVEELNLLLTDEIKKHKLVSNEKINVNNYAQNILKCIEKINQNTHHSLLELQQAQIEVDSWAKERNAKQDVKDISKTNLNENQILDKNSLINKRKM